MSRILSVSGDFSTQQSRLIQLPDIPGEVVMIHRVIWFVTNFTTATEVAVTLDHNVNLAITLTTNSGSRSQWFTAGMGINVEGPAPVVLEYTPPYELVGVQRFDQISSAGTISGKLVILYNLRKERNRTVWNEIRSRTSFERD